MLKFIDVQQNSPEWFDMRGGRVTGSNFDTVMANLGKSFGEPAKKYAVDIAIEQITGNAISGGYSNAHMKRGTEQEPLARMAYEYEYFCDVSNGGFWCDDFLGDSPDGLVDDDGVIEIKCHIPSVHYANIRRGTLPGTYKWQCIGHLYCTGREWLDFISYCPDFPEDSQLWVYRIYAKDLAEEMAAMNGRMEQFKELVAETKQTILMEK